MNETPEVVPGAEALDAWIEAREGRWADLREDCEERIIWHGDAGVPTEIALVYLHGFSASRQETAPLCDRIAASLGANLFYARLAGHGRSPEAMGEPGTQDWIDDALRALAVGRTIGKRVVLIGTSTGGTLAALAATWRPDDLAGLVLIAPNFGPADPRSGLALLPFARTWVPWVVGAERETEPENEGHARYWTTRYPIHAVITMMELVREVRRADLSRIQVPVLAVFSDGDQVVDARRTHKALAAVHAENLAIQVHEPSDSERAMNPTEHVIAGDVFAPDATGRMATLIEDWIAHEIDVPRSNA